MYVHTCVRVPAWRCNFDDACLQEEGRVLMLVAQHPEVTRFGRCWNFFVCSAGRWCRASVGRKWDAVVVPTANIARLFPAALRSFTVRWKPSNSVVRSPRVLPCCTTCASLLYQPFPKTHPPTPISLPIPGFTHVDRGTERLMDLSSAAVFRHYSSGQSSSALCAHKLREVTSHQVQPCHRKQLTHCHGIVPRCCGATPTLPSSLTRHA